MPDVLKGLNSFNAGELSPKLMGRTDLDKYHNGCATLENYMIQPYGGITRRPGLHFVAETKTSSKASRLIPFKASSVQSYILEFGDLYVRFFKNGAPLYGGNAANLVTNGTFDSGITGWTDYSEAGGSFTWNAANKRAGFYSSGVADSIAGQGLVTVIGHTYRVSASIPWRAITEGTARVRIGSSLHGTELADVSINGTTISFTFVAVGVTTYIEFALTQFGSLQFDDVEVIDLAGTLLELVSPYSESDLSDIRFVQSADVMYLVHPSHAPQRLSRFSDTVWTLKPVRFRPPPTSEQDTDISGGTAKIALSAISGAGIKIVSSGTPFIEGDKDRTIAYLDGEASITAYVSTSEMTADVLYDFDAALVDTTPVSTLTTDGGADKKVINFSAPHGITEAQATSGIWLRLTDGAQVGEMRKVASVTDADTVVLTAAFSIDQAGTHWSKHYAIDAGDWLLGGSPAGTCTVTPYPATVGSIVTATLSVVTNGWRTADVGKYIVGNLGIIRITQRDSGSVVKGELLVQFSSATGMPSGAWTLEEDDWNATDGYPTTVCFFEQRLLFAGIASKPTTVWASQSADYQNMARGALDGDALVYTIAMNNADVIHWLVDTRALIAGTAGGELRLTGGQDLPLTPSNVSAKPETTFGSAAPAPIRIGEFVLFIQRSGKALHDLLFTSELQPFKSNDLTILAEHITGDGLDELCYEQRPYSVVWSRRSDGVLLSMTYLAGEEVVGWARHITEGIVESMAVVPAQGLDQTWLIVQRSINGAVKRYVEYLDASRVTDASHAYSGAAATQITGLGHLEGEAVAVVADGEEVVGLTVVGGKITLATAASEVEVGLAYTPKCVTVRPEVKEVGTAQGLLKRWAECWARVLSTRGITINGEPQEPDEDYTGDLAVNLLGHDRDGQITIEQPHPYPSTILSLFGRLEVGA